MAKILGPIRFLIGQHNSWEGIEEGSELEELRKSLRYEVYREFHDIPGLEWKLYDHERLSEIAKQITETGELPHQVLLDFIKKQLVIINRHRLGLKKEKLWIEDHDKQGIGCCYSNGQGWEPNLIRPLYVGPREEKRPFVVEARCGEKVVQCNMLVQLLWECEMPASEDLVRLELERILRELGDKEKGALLEHARTLLPRGVTAV